MHPESRQTLHPGISFRRSPLLRLDVLRNLWVLSKRLLPCRTILLVEASDRKDGQHTTMRVRAGGGRPQGSPLQPDHGSDFHKEETQCSIG